jgi:hypothetical protein
MGLCGSSVEEVVNPEAIDASHFQFAKVTTPSSHTTTTATVINDTT